MEKIKLPKEVAEAIERTWSKYENAAHPLHIVLTNWKYLEHLAGCGDRDILLGYATNNPIEYMQALVNGYEVEQTPEDKVKEMIDHWKQRKKEHGENSQVIQFDKYGDYIAGASTILDLLNIKIEGVNAE